MLDYLLDVFRLKQYFDVLTGGRDLMGGLATDVEFVNTVRRTLLTFPWESHGAEVKRPFPPPRTIHLEQLAGRRTALVATGGSGALASVVGVFRAMTECGVRPEIISVCSGSSLFGFPLGAGLSVDAVARFTLSLRASDYVDVNWPHLASFPLSLGRGFAGFVKGEKLEETYRGLVGDLRLRDLAIPTYAPIWNVEENRLEYIGPRTYPDLPVATAVRVAVSLPLFIQPVPIDGYHWCDGGIVDIFPVTPVLEIEKRPDVAVAVNGFYPPEFAGEPAHGWEERRGSVFHVAAQVRTSQQVQLARANLAQLRRSCDVLMTNPVPYSVVRGVGFYEQFMDNRDWPEFMRLGRSAALEALRAYRPRARSRSRRAEAGSASGARRSGSPNRSRSG